MQTTITTFDDTAAGWERTPCAFVAGRTTVTQPTHSDGYSRMLQHFFGTIAKPPDRTISSEVFGWAYGVELFRRAAVVSDHRCAPRMPLQLLPLPDPHERGHA